MAKKTAGTVSVIGATGDGEQEATKSPAKRTVKTAKKRARVKITLGHGTARTASPARTASEESSINEAAKAIEALLGASRADGGNAVKPVKPVKPASPARTAKKTAKGVKKSAGKNHARARTASPVNGEAKAIEALLGTSRADGGNAVKPADVEVMRALTYALADLSLSPSRDGFTDAAAARIFELRARLFPSHKFLL